MPQPVLRLSGIDRTTLERSLRYAVSQERFPSPRLVKCTSLHSCEITYLDPAYPASAYRIPYQVAGEQLPGCWMAMRRRALDPLPYTDAAQGQLELAACASWLPRA
jgi:hypothetical protein